MEGCNFRNILLINVPNCYRGKFHIFWLKAFTLVRIFQFRTRSYHSITDIVEIMNTFIQEKTITQKFVWQTKCLEECKKVRLASQRKGRLEFFSTDLGFVFKSIVVNEFEVLLRREGPHTPVFLFYIVRIHFLMIYTNMNKYNIVGDTNVSLFRCSFSISKLKSVDIIRTGQYMNYQTFSDLRFRQLLKYSFHSFHMDLRVTSGEKTFLFLWVILDLFWCSEKFPLFIFIEKKNITIWLLQNMWRLHTFEVPVNSVEEISALAQVIGRTAIPFCVYIQNVWVLTSWSLPSQKLQILSVVEKSSKQLLRVWEGKIWKKSWVVVAVSGRQP